MLGWLLVLALAQLLSVGFASCPTEFFGEKCEQKCRCSSPVSHQECACASSNGQCDELCMDGEYVVVTPWGLSNVTVVVLLSMSATLILGAFCLVLWNRDLWDKTQDDTEIHRTRAVVRVSQDMESFQLTPLGAANSRFLVYNFNEVDYRESKRQLQSIESMPSIDVADLSNNDMDMDSSTLFGPSVDAKKSLPDPTEGLYSPEKERADLEKGRSSVQKEGSPIEKEVSRPDKKGSAVEKEVSRPDKKGSAVEKEESSVEKTKDGLAVTVKTGLRSERDGHQIPVSESSGEDSKLSDRTAGSPAYPTSSDFKTETETETDKSD